MKKDVERLVGSFDIHSCTKKISHSSRQDHGNPGVVASYINTASGWVAPAAGPVCACSLTRCC